MKRRAFLASGLALTAGLAGCVGGSDESDDGVGADDDDDNTGTGDGDPGADIGEGVASANLTTTGSDCGGPDDDRLAAEVADDGGSVTLAGVIEAPNPCHEAVLVSASVADGQLSAIVDVEADLGDDEECVQCVGAISYEATVEFADGVTIEGGMVDHATGATHEFTSGDGAPVVGRTELETTDARCLGEGDTAGIDIDRADGVVVLDGGFTASDPCNEAVLESATVEADTLHVTVGVESTLEEGAACQQCQGFVSYEAGVGVFPLDWLEAVRVEHPDGSTYGE